MFVGGKIRILALGKLGLQLARIFYVGRLSCKPFSSCWPLYLVFTMHEGCVTNNMNFSPDGVIAQSIQNGLMELLVMRSFGSTRRGSRMVVVLEQSVEGPKLY